MCSEGFPLLLGFPAAKYLFPRQTFALGAVISNNKQFPKKHAMNSCWHWHRSANFVSTPFSVWSCGSRRRIGWREPSIGYLLKFIWCTMIAFVVSYPSYYLHNSCFSCHAHASLGYVPMLAFFFGVSRYLDGPSVSRPIDSFLLWFPFAIKPSPLVAVNVSNFCSCFVILVPLTSSKCLFYILNSLAIGKSHLIIVSTYIKEAVMLIKSRKPAPRENPMLISSKSFSLCHRVGCTSGPGWVSFKGCWARVGNPSSWGGGEVNCARVWYAGLVLIAALWFRLYFEIGMRWGSSEQRTRLLPCIS